ncbi:hypothetical protein [Pseudarthrobacter sp. C4D7]|uniref:hypothetical protein n=1 Tax=Pseudarthrobacter sp. C4D7 TaxID=2735268 RepID=UPI001584606D|nr:hypothetical protein [Pseudarthrobacter sp. C4D7]NUT70893.1 hypothetical protein [Pseudarthrobacter sp. C4D7]
MSTPPNQKPPQKKGRLGWVLGATAVAVALLCLLGFAGCSALAGAINGGGSPQEKASEMKARADNVPEDDWKVVFRQDPTVDPWCLSIDTSCLRLSARWSVGHTVILDEAAARFGMTPDPAGPATEPSTGCITSKPDGVRKESLCIQDSPAGQGAVEVTIQMERD